MITMIFMFAYYHVANSGIGGLGNLMDYQLNDYQVINTKLRNKEKDWRANMLLARWDEFLKTHRYIPKDNPLPLMRGVSSKNWERIKKINEEKLLEIIVEMDKQLKRLSKKNGKEIKLSPKRRAKIIYEAYEEEELSYIKKGIEVISS